MRAADLMAGERLVDQRARKALPILVRQAWGGETITYGDLARELDIPNPRTLNHVLDKIGRAIQSLSAIWAREIPEVQFLVVNAQTRVPGDGIVPFQGQYRQLTRAQRKLVSNQILQKVYMFDGWADVLSAFGLERFDAAEALVSSAARCPTDESEAHQSLKEWIAANPRAIGVPSGRGELERPLPSGDRLDVFFSYRDRAFAIEVKSHVSNDADLTRGLFQCVKYLAVLEAEQVAMGRQRNSEAILVLENRLPEALLSVRNALGVTVVELNEDARLALREWRNVSKQQ